MPFRPLNIVGGWYTDDALPWVQQDICNYIPVISEMPGPISSVKAVDAPGPKPFVEIASNAGIRGMRDVEGKLMVVAGTGLYQITNSLVAIRYGTVPGTGPVTMSHNQQGIANELLVGNGSAGYVFNTSTLAFNRITDPAFPGSKASDYLDSYLLGVEPLGRFWYHSDLANAESYNSLDRYESETAPDRIVTLRVSNEEVVVFNQGTTDFFVNTGAATGTFQSKGVSCNVGCAGTNGVVKLDNTLMWLDNYGVFQRLDGYTPVPISTRALESAIAQFKDRWVGVVATTYQDRGRKIAYWTFPNGLTFGYDVTTRLWHRLQSYGRTNFRAPQIVYWNKKWIAGDSQTGRLYELDWDYMLDVDRPHVRKLKTAPLHGDGVKLQMHAAKLVFDTGGPVTVAAPFPEQPLGPSITGDMPNAGLGDSDPFSYVVTFGDAPTGTVTLRSGTFPPGRVLSGAGVVTGAYTTLGIYTYVLRITDTNGLWADVEDTVLVTLPMLLIASSVTSQVVAIPSNDGIDWSANPIATEGTDPDLQYPLFLIGLPGRYWGKGLASATPAAYSDSLGLNWTATGGDVVRGPGQAYTAGTLFLGRHVGSGYLFSTDDGETFSAGPNNAVFPVALNKDDGKLAAMLNEIFVPLAIESDDAGATWSSGIAHGVVTSVGGCSGTDGDAYFFGGSTISSGGVPKLVKFKSGVITNIPLPDFATATAATAFGAGAGVKVVGTNSGEIAFDDGGGFRLATTTLTGPVIQLYWNGVVFVALEGGIGPGDSGLVYYSYDGDTFTNAPTYTSVLPYSVAQVMEAP